MWAPHRLLEKINITSCPQGEGKKGGVREDGRGRGRREKGEGGKREGEGRGNLISSHTQACGSLP